MNKSQRENRKSSAATNAAINGGTRISIRSRRKPITKSPAKIAERYSLSMEIGSESTAAMSATLRIGLETNVNKYQKKT